MERSMTAAGECISLISHKTHTKKILAGKYQEADKLGEQAAVSSSVSSVQII